METVNKQRNLDIFFQLTKRHLFMFFRNRVRMLYTLLVPVVIFVVYIFFLRNLELTSMQLILEEQLGIALEDDETIRRLSSAIVDCWMLSGITAISTFTVSLQTNSINVNDKESGVNRDFVSSPISRNVLIASYFLCNFIVSFVICAIFDIICFIYLACLGEFYFTFAMIMALLGILIYSVILATLFTVFICSFIKHEGTLASFIAIFSTAVGFLMGAYVPFGTLPKWVQDVCLFLPWTYSCSLLRYAFLAEPFSQLSAYILASPEIFAGGEAFLEEISVSFGFDLEFFNITVGVGFQSVAVAVFIAILLVLNIFSGRRLVNVLGSLTKRKDKKKKELSPDGAVAEDTVPGAEETSGPVEIADASQEVPSREAEKEKTENLDRDS